jgi:hypothetical protein
VVKTIKVFTIEGLRKLLFRKHHLIEEVQLVYIGLSIFKSIECYIFIIQWRLIGMHKKKDLKYWQNYMSEKGISDETLFDKQRWPLYAVILIATLILYLIF